MLPEGTAAINKNKNVTSIIMKDMQQIKFCPKKVRPDLD
jgi:hypothetical protein